MNGEGEQGIGGGDEDNTKKIILNVYAIQTYTCTLRHDRYVFISYFTG